MRSYPLLGLFLATRHAVSKMTSSPAILRPTATGVSLLFLSLKHSSSVIEVRVTDVTGWPHGGNGSCPCLPQLPREGSRGSEGTAGPPHAASDIRMCADKEGKGQLTDLERVVLVIT